MRTLPYTLENAGWLRCSSIHWTAFKCFSPLKTFSRKSLYAWGFRPALVPSWPLFPVLSLPPFRPARSGWVFSDERVILSPSRFRLLSGDDVATSCKRKVGRGHRGVVCARGLRLTES